jgi:hypothetical protein
MPTMKMLLLTLALLLFVGLGCSRPNPRILPQELAGHWTTDSTNYRGRFLELSQTYVIIGAGEKGNPDVQTIDRVDSVPMDYGTLYTIHSTTHDGLPSQIALQFSPREGGEIRIKNQVGVIWKIADRKSPSTSATGNGG